MNRINRLTKPVSRSWGGIQSPENSIRRARPLGVHWGLLTVVLSLLAIGCISVFSATITDGWVPNGTATEYGRVLKHLIFIGFSAVVACIVTKIPTPYYARFWKWIGSIAIFLLLLVLFPGIGKRINNAQRWISFGPVLLQVVEVVKICLVIWTAQFVVVRQNYMHSWKHGFAPVAIYMVLLAFLVMMQPDLGSTVVLLCISIGILILGGLGAPIIGTIIALMVLFVFLMIYFTPWRLARLVAFADPWDKENVISTSYQLSHSLIAFGRGELWGVGLGESIEKLFYLPEAHTDFIMAVWAEETGLLGVSLVLLLFYFLVRYAFEIGRQAIKLEEYFAGFLAQGIAIWFAAQSFINIGVACGALPTKGLPLPFVSYGGSSMLAAMIGVALLFRVDKENKIHMQGGQV